MSRTVPLRILVPLLLTCAVVLGQTSKQPKVAPGPNEPDWVVILRDRYGLSMFDDLKNPVVTTPEATDKLEKMYAKKA